MAIDTEKTYRRYGPMVLRRCRALLADEEHARDAMHDVFVNLLRHRGRLQDRGMSSLLFRIATNVCLNKIRSRGRRPSEPSSDVLARIAQATDDESRMAARSMLARLFAGQPNWTAEMAVMHLHDGMTLEEVARDVGMSVSGVRKRLRKLRASLEELAVEDVA